MKSRLRETEGATQNYQTDVSRKVAIYEQNISALRIENEDLKRKINELGNESNRKLVEASQ